MRVGIIWGRRAPAGGLGEPPKQDVIRRMKVDFPHPAGGKQHVTQLA